MKKIALLLLLTGLISIASGQLAGDALRKQSNARFNNVNIDGTLATNGTATFNGTAQFYSDILISLAGGEETSWADSDGDSVLVRPKAGGNFGAYATKWVDGATLLAAVDTTGGAYFAGNVGVGTTGPNLLSYERVLTIDAPTGGRTFLELRGDRGVDDVVAGLSFHNVQSTQAYDWIANIQAERDGDNEAGKLSFSTYNSSGDRQNVMTIGSTGNIGIGTTPFYQLTLKGTTGFLDTDEATPAGTDSSIQVYANAGVPTISGKATDGDNSTITWNTSDQMVFTGASGGYSFDDDIISNTSIGVYAPASSDTGFVVTFDKNATKDSTVFVPKDGGLNSYTKSVTAILGTSTSYVGVKGVSTENAGVWGLSTEYMGLKGEINPVTTATVDEVMRLIRTTSGTAANGIGNAFTMYIEDDGGTPELAGKISSVLTNAGASTEVSSMGFWTRTGGAAVIENMTLTNASLSLFSTQTAELRNDGTDAEVTYLVLYNTDGEACYIYPNATQDGILVSSTKP